MHTKDSQFFRRFANTDTVLALDLEQNESFQVKLRLEVDDIDKVTTYDIACKYFVYLEERFQKNFPHLVPFIKKMRWGVPALHVQGHQDSCTYLFGTAYMECVGAFSMHRLPSPERTISAPCAFDSQGNSESKCLPELGNWCSGGQAVRQTDSGKIEAWPKTEYFLPPDPSPGGHMFDPPLYACFLH
jgi:hypothetical protein